MFTPKRPQDQQNTYEERKSSATETPEHAMKSDKPKQPQPITPIPDTSNISDEGNVFVADTPAKTSPKSSTLSFFASSKNSKDIAVPNSLGFEKIPRTSGTHTKNNSHVEGDVLSGDLRSESLSKIGDDDVTRKTKKASIRVSDSEVFDVDENESNSIGKKPKGSFSNETELVKALPESIKLSVSESECDLEQKTKNQDKFQSSSRNVPDRNVDITVKQAKLAKPVIPDSPVLDTETNDFSSIQAFKRGTERTRENAIPDSLEFDESPRETTNENYALFTSTKRKHSEASNNAKRLKQIEDKSQQPVDVASTTANNWKTSRNSNVKTDCSNEESAFSLQTNSAGYSTKRRRMTEDNDCEKRNGLPMKRVKNDKEDIDNGELQSGIK